MVKKSEDRRSATEHDGTDRHGGAWGWCGYDVAASEAPRFWGLNCAMGNGEIACRYGIANTGDRSEVYDEFRAHGNIRTGPAMPRPNRLIGRQL